VELLAHAVGHLTRHDDQVARGQRLFQYSVEHGRDDALTQQELERSQAERSRRFLDATRRKCGDSREWPAQAATNDCACRRADSLNAEPLPNSADVFAMRVALFVLALPVTT
jgi:hypothetical protein